MTPPAGERWSLAARAADLQQAAGDELDLLVIGGGITGAGVLRDAASRGLRTLLVERSDFASGTSGRSSKLAHGGLRYIAEGHLGVVRSACRERDLLVALNPNLVRPQPFLLPAYQDSRLPLWKVRGAMWSYAALGSFRRASRTRMLSPDDVMARAPALRSQGLRGAGHYLDARVDDARLVIETLKSARRLGGAAVNHAEVVAFLRDGARVRGVRVRDALGGGSFELRARAVVNAAGPAVERVRGMDAPLPGQGLRPAKGVHLVVPRRRVRSDYAITHEAADGRHVFLVPWDDMVLVGTTDSFTEEIDEPVVTIEEVHYLLDWVNRTFPGARLTTNDLCSVFAGVRPLAADPDEDVPPSSVSREERIFGDGSGLISAAGGKLTTYRATAEKIVDRVVRKLAPRVFPPSRTASLPLRRDDFDPAELEAELGTRFGVARWRAAHLVSQYGAAARIMLEEAPPALRAPVGASRFTLAELPWCMATECTASLRDLLEHRVRMALWSAGQGLPELPLLAKLAADAAGWDAERAAAEADAYADAVRRRYQIVAPATERTAA